MTNFFKMKQNSCKDCLTLQGIVNEAFDQYLDQIRSLQECYASHGSRVKDH